MEGMTRLVIGSAFGALIGGAACLGVEALHPQHSSAEGFQNRPASVFLKNDDLAKKLGARFIDECVASQRTPSSEVEVTCYGEF